MDGWIQDLRYGLRMLRSHLGVTATAILALGLGCGANTAIFSVVKAVLLDALPYREAGEIVMLWEDATPRGGTARVPVAPGNFLDWRRANPAFTELGAIRNESLRLSDFDEPIVPLLHQASANYFDLLGVEPLLGRGFRPGEDRPGSDRVVVLSYGLWRDALGGDPEIVGRSLRLDGESYTVIGVMGPEFLSVHLFDVQPDLWTPLVLSGLENDRRDRRLVVYGRLRPDTGHGEAQAAMSTLAGRLAVAFPDTNQGWDVRLVPIREEAVGRVRPILLILLAAVGFVLLIACANVAHLTLARTVERTQEIAVRRSLGATRSRLARQLVIETLLLSGLGGLAGLALAAWGIDPLLGVIPAGAAVPFLDRVSLDGGVLLFTLALSLLAGVLAGLAPVRLAGGLGLVGSLKEGGQRSSARREMRRFGRFLVVAEVALALLLVAGAALVAQSFRNLRGYEPGFDAGALATLRVSLRGEVFAEARQRTAFFEELADRLAVLPGAASASAVSFPPPLTPFQAATFVLPGEPPEPGHEPMATVRAVLPGYFPTMGIPVLRGRGIGREDRAETLPAAVVNQALADRFFGSRDPVGETLVIESSAQRELSAERVERRIVGVVGNVRSAGTDPRAQPVIYVPHAQAAVPVMSFVLRAHADPAALLRPAEQAAWGMGGNLNVFQVETLEERIERLDWIPEASTVLLGLFAALALALGAAGIYAVVSFTVSKRTHEIGVRMSLGASGARVRRMVLAEVMKLTLLGVACGVPLALGLVRVLASQLFGVSTFDPATYLSVVVLLVAVAGAACLGPAYRASRVDAIQALRHP